MQTAGYRDSHGDVKYSVGSRVNNIVITIYGTRWALDLLGDHFLSYMNVLCTPETNTLFHAICN